MWHALHSFVYEKNACKIFLFIQSYFCFFKQFYLLKHTCPWRVNFLYHEHWIDKRKISGHVHIISYRFLFRFTKLYGMMWTHFPFNIYVEYEFKNFEHYFNVFWWKKQPIWKKTRESTAIVITKECRKY